MFGRDVISHGAGFKKKKKKTDERAHTKGAAAAAAAAAFSVLFSGVSAWVNRLFEVSESWISEAAPVTPPPTLPPPTPALALKLNHSQVKLHFEPAALYHNSAHFPLYSPAAQRSWRTLRRGCQMCKNAKNARNFFFPREGYCV